ncbi:MAG TPA: hypothetical protein VG938_05090 [Verrucomicrobiae bacterium]|nr:hypothetical protein [Verrucomicrobiae bacterium]
MVKGSSKYGGAVAVIVFGVGLLIVGSILKGLEVLGVGVLALAVVCAPTLTARAFFLSVGAVICSGVFIYCAISNEITGTARYAPGMRGRSVTATRADSPAKFREVVNFRWAAGGFFLIVGGLGLAYCRKLDDCG